MITAIVQHDDHDLPMPAVAQELFKEGLEGEGVELLGLACHQNPFLGADRPKNANAFPGGSMKQDGIHVLGRDPHPAPGPVLLEMAFVQKPQVNLFAACEQAKFF